MNKLVAFAVAVALAPAFPATAATPTAGLAACGDIADSPARLQCFDRELAKSRPAATAPAAATAAAPAATAPTAAPAAAAVAPAAAASRAAPPPSPAPAAAGSATPPPGPRAGTPSFGGESVAGS